METSPQEAPDPSVGPTSAPAAPPKKNNTGILVCGVLGGGCLLLLVLGAIITAIAALAAGDKSYRPPVRPTRSNYTPDRPAVTPATTPPRTVTPKPKTTLATLVANAEVEKGFRAYRKRSFRTAIIHLQKAIDGGANKVPAAQLHTIVGNAHAELREFDKSIAAHEKALKLDPKYYKAWVNLGVVYRRKSDLDKAESCYKKALAINPDYAQLQSSLGALYLTRKQPAKGLPYLEKAVKLSPKLATARSNLALGYAMVGKFEEADKELTLAVKLGYKHGASIRKRIADLKKKATAAENP